MQPTAFPSLSSTAAYLLTVPLEELIDSVERTRKDAQLRYVVLYGALCDYYLSRAAHLEGSYLRTFALELKEQLAQTLAALVISIFDCIVQTRNDCGRRIV